MKINNFFKLVIAIMISEMAGVIGALFTTPAVQSSWYAGIVKSALNPPAWVFGPVWTTLYALMGISFFLIWKQHPYILENVRMLRLWKLGISLFFTQLALNTLWSIIFFGSISLTINDLNNIGIALVEIVFLWLAILATIIAFAKISKLAAWLLVPYILWVSFAMYLNYAIWMLN
jgi:translocator protein